MSTWFVNQGAAMSGTDFSAEQRSTIVSYWQHEPFPEDK
jgi:hypothetical protein